MTATDIRECLRRRWPDDSYLSIEEAPEDSARQGRKLDLLVIALWRSRGLERDGVETKVSARDWKRELEDHEKSDFWWRKTHRFWVAVPAKLAGRVRDELPGTWGLLSCEPDKPPKVACVGLMRAATNSGFNALRRAEARGYDTGYKAAERVAASQSVDDRMREQLERLRGRVQEFEEAAGCHPITGHWPDPTDIGRLVALVRAEKADPGSAAKWLELAATRVERDGEALTQTAVAIREAAEQITKVGANGKVPA